MRGAGEREIVRHSFAINCDFFDARLGERGSNEFIHGLLRLLNQRYRL